MPAILTDGNPSTAIKRWSLLIPGSLNSVMTSGYCRYRWGQYSLQMIHHMSLGVSDIIASGSFYDAILKPLGYTRVFDDLRPGERYQAIGYGVATNEDIFTIKERNSEFLSPDPGFHIAFSAPSCEAIAMWHRQGVEKGAIDRGGQKVWTDFGTNYYSGYLTDPDGYQIEAVFKNI
jgi:catechol 2,3-dioxygenase-like lactoylglutathione lyase family enzyme